MQSGESPEGKVPWREPADSSQEDADERSQEEMQPPRPEGEPPPSFGGMKREIYWLWSFGLGVPFTIAQSSGREDAPVVALIFLLVGMWVVSQRLKNVGYSPLWALHGLGYPLIWMLAPADPSEGGAIVSLLFGLLIVSLWVGATCLIAPEGYGKTRTMDPVGKGCAVTLIAFSILMLLALFASVPR